MFDLLKRITHLLATRNTHANDILVFIDGKAQ